MGIPCEICHVYGKGSKVVHCSEVTCTIIRHKSCVGIPGNSAFPNYSGKKAERIIICKKTDHHKSQKQGAREKHVRLQLPTFSGKDDECQ
ncbi:hypothetical protein B9Z55_028774 [Caenorhabditis nigoni]|nr:hypothetical protein B9Z55_028774 [Caenorhabditis nigoni]